MSRLIVTDYTFPSLEVEKRRLGPIGLTVDGIQDGNRKEWLAKVPSADFGLTQSARLDAKAIERTEKAKVIVR